jgi:hypothetical protein
VEAIDPATEGTYSVYCVACRAVYAKPLQQADSTPDRGCPNCGSTSWVALGVVTEPELQPPPARG